MAERVNSVQRPKRVSRAAETDESVGDARRDRWREHRIARRAEFVEAALRALDIHGPEMGMDDVAAEAGVTKPVLYRHFVDKADLHLALVGRGTEILFARLRAAVTSELAPLPRIRATLDAYFSVIEQHPNLYRLLARRSFAGRPRDADVVAEDERLRTTAVTALLGDYLRMPRMDPRAAEPWAHAVAGMVHNTCEWWLDSHTMSRDSVVEYLTQIVWAAIDGLTRRHGIVLDPNRPVDDGGAVTLDSAFATDGGPTQ